MGLVVWCRSNAAVHVGGFAAMLGGGADGGGGDGAFGGGGWGGTLGSWWGACWGLLVLLLKQAPCVFCVKQEEHVGLQIKMPTVLSCVFHPAYPGAREYPTWLGCGHDAVNDSLVPTATAVQSQHRP